MRPNQSQGLTSPKRRALLRTAIQPATVLNSSVAMNLNPANPTQKSDGLVMIFLRGGMDALTLLPPVGDAQYFAERPTLHVPTYGQTHGAVQLGDPLFGLSPKAAPLLPAYQAGDLAFVHTAGSTDPTRSHFHAMRFMEAGVPGQNLPPASQLTGWLARHLRNTQGGPSRPRAVFLESILPISLRGYPQALPIPDPNRFRFGGDPSTQTSRRQVLGGLFANAPSGLADSANSTLVAVDRISAIDFNAYQPENGAVYPGSPFGQKMKHAAAMFKAGIGAEVIELDLGSWDFHANMGPHTGQLATYISDLSRGMAAFYADMGAGMDRVNVVAISEFGRRVAENGSHGTDHGHGGAMLLMGKHVNGGQIDHDWQGLSDPDLDDGSLQVRIDYRDVIGELLRKRMASPDIADVFPNHTVVERGLFG